MRKSLSNGRRRAVPALLAGALLLGACSGDTDTGPDDATTTATPGDGSSSMDAGREPQTVRFLFFGGPEEREAYERVADAFTEEHPAITVEASVVADQDDLLARLTSSFGAGNPPDVFLINFRKYGLYASQGVLQPVGPLLDASEVLDEDSFYSAPLDAFRLDGEELTCLPQNISSLVTYLNLDLFEAAGIEPPSGDWAWDEFLRTAGDLTAEDRSTLGIGTSPKLIRLAPMVWSNGGEVVDDPDAPTRLTLDTPEAAGALDFLLALQAEGVAPDDLEEQARDSQARFLDGSLAMFWSSRREVPTFRTIEDFDWDVAPFPIAPGGERVTMLHADAFCLAADGNVDAAWAFVQFALGPVGARILAESGRTVPSNRSVAESEAFLRDDVPPANARVYLDNAEIVRATPSTADWNEVEGLADDILEELYYGRIDRETALARLAELRIGASG